MLQPFMRIPICRVPTIIPQADGYQHHGSILPDRKLPCFLTTLQALNSSRPLIPLLLRLPDNALQAVKTRRVLILSLLWELMPLISL